MNIKNANRANHGNAIYLVSNQMHYFSFGYGGINGLNRMAQKSEHFKTHLYQQVVYKCGHSKHFKLRTGFVGLS